MITTRGPDLAHAVAAHAAGLVPDLADTDLTPPLGLGLALGDAQGLDQSARVPSGPIPGLGPGLRTQRGPTPDLVPRAKRRRMTVVQGLSLGLVHQSRRK